MMESLEKLLANSPLMGPIIGMGLAVIAKTAETNSKNDSVSHFVSAIVSTHGHMSLSADERNKLAHWLKARIHADSLVVVEK